MRVAALLLIGLIAACAATPSETPDASETPLPPAPDVPPLWRTITSDEGDVRLVVPPDLVVLHTAASVHAYREAADGEPITVAAIPPRQLNQPRGDESAVEWANAGGWLTAGQGHVDEAEVRSRDVLLPAGPTIELTSSWVLGGQGPHWTMLHLIRTSSGYGLFQVSGPGAIPDEPPEEVRLMRELVDFGG